MLLSSPIGGAVLASLSYANKGGGPMQEDIENKTLSLMINTGKLTERTLATAFIKHIIRRTKSCPKK